MTWGRTSSNFACINFATYFSTLADPKLTELGIEQARVVHRAWNAEIMDGIPLPESIYSSPFSRALHTTLITFGGILINAPDSPHGQKRPIIKEVGPSPTFGHKTTLKI